MTVHNHGIDPSCKERLVGECLLKPGAIVLDLRAANPHGIPEFIVENLVETLRDAPFAGCNGVADQIEAQTKPPRIPEPGIGCFVNARKPDRTHANFVRITKWSWVEVGHGASWAWDDLIDPVEVEGGAA